MYIPVAWSERRKENDHNKPKGGRVNGKIDV